MALLGEAAGSCDHGKFLILTLSLFSLVHAAESESTTFTMKNNCPYKIWPAISDNSSITSKPDFAGLEHGASVTVQVNYSTDQIVGRTVRVWGRTNCTHDSSGKLSCITGDCGSQHPICSMVNMDPFTTVAFFYQSSRSDIKDRERRLDNYFVTLLSGFNLPLLVIPVGRGTKNAIPKCSTTGCNMDLNPICPIGLQMKGDGGNTLGCRNPCDVLGEDRYCCEKKGYVINKSCQTPLSTAFQKACPLKDSFCYGADYVINFCLTNVSSDPVDETSTSEMKPLDYLIYPLKLVSGAGSFMLGFFTTQNTNLTYLGIWHASDEQHKVWIANLNSPIKTIAIELQLVMNSSGNPRILNGENDTMVVVDRVKTNNKTIAVLQDSGNFVLKDSDNENQILWQSFDHPTSILLPGMKLGFNLTTAKTITLTSWQSSYNPTSGAFTLGMERIQGSGQLVIRRRGNIYWTSGPWKNQSFRYFPSLSNHSVKFPQKLNFVSENDGMYFTFETTGSNLSVLELSPNGEIIDHGNGRIPISPYHDFCYGYEKDNGCWPSKSPHCRGKDKFELKSGNFVGTIGVSEDANSNISLSNCMERCWNNCTCNGFASYSNDTGCRIWIGNHTFQVDLSGKSRRIYVLHADKTSNGKKNWIWGLVAVSIAIPILLGFVCCAKIRKHKLKEKERRLQEQIDELAESDGFENVNEMVTSGKKGQPGMKMFSIASVMAATNAFLPENKLGEGGFGSVYKGQLADGREIAVKRLSRTSRQGLREFKNELMLIFKLQHRNLVQVLGFCIHEEERMLIYEYMPNKSLDFFLFDLQRKGELDWKKRLNIIEGVAQGLLYLHQYSRMRVIHRDLKASNILLDEQMNPKIADFGLARMFKHNETEAVTKRVIGTYGYMSPEYVMEGTFSIKSDVFSFGVLMLEIISGRKNSHFFKFDDYSVKLVGYAWDLWKAGEAIELKDPALGDSANTNQILRCIHVGLLCVQERAGNRPTMLQVISMLNNETMDLPAPKQPGFLTGRNEIDSNPRSGGPISANGLSISDLEPR